MSIVPPAHELRLRLSRFRDVLRRRKLSAALISNERNVRYLSGFTGNDSALLITQNKKYLLTDFRYVEEAQKTAKGWRVVIEKYKKTKDGKTQYIVPHGLMEKAGYIAKKIRLRRLFVEPGDLHITDMRALRKAARGIRVRSQDGMVGELRLIKSDWEVKQIEKALRIQERSYLELCRSIRTGISEREAAAKLRYFMVVNGADDQAFDVMFQIGSNSSLPHGRPTERRLNGSAIILLDFGAKHAGYHSDLTRTFFLGSIPARLRKIHGIVMEAQKASIAKIAPGVEMSEVDAAGREVIAKAGYAKAFGHSTGHGLGLDIHEAPSLSSRAKGTLQPGMVVTVEPGIYIPGLGGVRIEDDVLVTKTGSRVLSHLKKGLRWNGQNR